MDKKAEIVNRLREVFNRWQQLLASLSEEEILAPLAPSTWAIKDVIAHLWAWQQLSIARLEAAVQHREPRFSRWPSELEPESEEHLEQINTWIYEAYRDRPWPGVFRDWQAGYLRLLELAETLPEDELLDPKRYLGLGGHPRLAVLAGSCEHHPEDHLEPQLADHGHRAGQDGT